MIKGVESVSPVDHSELERKNKIGNSGKPLEMGTGKFKIEAACRIVIFVYALQ